ncbi:NADPH-dependent 7-cyano-7-deazaguanine reductase QueF [bacterium]|nr:NADPH-dependent 7-cyano-7-deazaguanine reductase QueF [bacterium]RQV94423.1 MAG: NADPH-dependent 7-cyano-7-deazaguanine reductase QueF [bacterium]
MTEKLKRGQKEILNSKLSAVENRYPQRDYEVEITLPEFTCLCPITGYPDFATIHVKYIPDKLIIELKSLKLYINKFRDQEVFHEESVNRILDDLVKVCQPRWMEVVGDFNPRGNVKTVVKAEYKKES